MKLQSEIEKLKSFIPAGFALFLIVFVSLSFTLRYYFYSDDYSTFYHLQNNTTPYWPYNFIPYIFLPFYKLFGLKPEVYTILGLITYFLATLSVYALSLITIRNKSIAFFTSAIFATGYVGLDQFTQLALSTLNNLSSIAISIVLITYIYFIQTKRKFYYLLSLILFTFTMIVFPFRGFTLLLFMPAIETIVTLKFKNIRSIFNQLLIVFLRLIPFLVIAGKFGIFSYGKVEGETAIVPSHIQSLFTIPFSPEFLSELVRIVGRIVAPDEFVGRFFQLTLTQDNFFLIGLLFLAFSTFTALALYKRGFKSYSRGLLIFMAIMLGGIAGNLIRLLSFDSNGPINRYLNLPFIGYSGTLSMLFYLLFSKISKKNKRKFNFLYSVSMIIIISVFISLSIKFEKEIVKERSDPSKSFFKQILTYIPNVSRKTLFYFDYADYHPTFARFNYIMVGAYLPREAALAVHYKTTLDKIEIKNSFEDLQKEIIKNPKQKYYTFYYDQNGLHNTTEEVENLLARGGEKILLHGERTNNNPFVPEVELKTNQLSLVPFTMHFLLQINPLNYSSFTFPYTNLPFNDPILTKYKSGKLDKESIFSYLLSRKSYYEKASVKVSGYHTMHTAELLIDDRADTYWLDDQSSYVFGLKPWIEIDLGEEKEIGKILWANESEPRFPKDFTIEVSKNKKIWKKVKVEKRERLAEGSLIETVSIPSVVTRFVKLQILSTQAYEPSFSEIEVIDERYSDVDLIMTRRIKDNPLEYIKDRNDLDQTYAYLTSDSNLTIKTLTKEDVISETYDLKLPVIFDGQFYDYSVTIPPRGIKLQKIIFRLPYPAKMQVKNVWLEYNKIAD